MTKKETVVDHFVATHLGASIKAAEPYRIAIIWALCVWDFVKDDREFVELKKRGLGADGISALTGISESTAKRHLHSMAKGPVPVVEKVHGRRDLGERTSWRLVAPVMRWAEAKRLLTVRLPQVRTLRGQLPLLDTVRAAQARTPPDRPSRTERASGPVEHGCPPPVRAAQARTNIKDLRPRSKTLKEDHTEAPPADAGEKTFLNPGRQLRAFFSDEYKKHHGKKMSKVRFNWMSGTEASLVDDHGLQEMKNRVLNFFSDRRRSTHSYHAFLSKPDDWVKAWTFGGVEKIEPLSAAQKWASDLGLKVHA